MDSNMSSDENVNKDIIEELDDSKKRIGAIFSKNWVGFVPQFVFDMENEGLRLQALGLEKKGCGAYISALCQGRRVWSTLFSIPFEKALEATLKTMETMEYDVVTDQWRLPLSFHNAWVCWGEGIELKERARVIMQTGLLAQGIEDKEPALIRWAMELSNECFSGAAFEQGVQVASCSKPVRIAAWLKDIDDAFYRARNHNSGEQIEVDADTASELEEVAAAVRDMFANGLDPDAFRNEGVSLQKNTRFETLANALIDSRRAWLAKEIYLDPIHNTLWSQISTDADASKAKGESALTWAQYAFNDAAQGSLGMCLMEELWNEKHIEPNRYVEDLKEDIRKVDYGGNVREAHRRIIKWLFAIEECFVGEDGRNNKRQSGHRWSVTLADKDALGQTEKPSLPQQG